MAYRGESNYTSRSSHDRSKRKNYVSKHLSHFDSRMNDHSRYIETERELHSPPRRRRWAAGYIDRQSCASYAYINTRSSSPGTDYPSDTEYIAKPRHRVDAYVQSRTRRGGNTHNLSTSTPSPRHYRKQAKSSMRNSKVHLSSADKKRAQYGSDVASVNGYEANCRRCSSPTSSTSDVEKRSDVISDKDRPLGSDIASIRSRRSSSSRSDCRSSRSWAARSDVQERRRTSRSESDSEGGYISLDEYITGRSDCVSNRSGSEGGGEGSDAVGSDDVGSSSDEGEGSDAVTGSDVVSLSDHEGSSYEEDCIEDDYYGGSRGRYQGRY